MRPSNKELKLTKPSIMELRSLTLCSADLTAVRIAKAMLRRLAQRGQAWPPRRHGAVWRILTFVAGLALVLAADATVATRRVQTIRALLRRGMTGPEVIRAVGPWAGLIEAPGCFTEPAADCRHIRLATRGPLLAAYVIDVVMDAGSRVDRIEQAGPTWAL